MDKFWAKVDKTRGCWLWKASTNGNGYGQHFYNGKMQKAHRLAYKFLVGEIPNGLQLDHLCRVRHCVNPKHLEPVTGRENCLRGNTGKHSVGRGRKMTKLPTGLTM